jgi:pimeloyl-ACP methyl ester carboxylesterase
MKITRLAYRLTLLALFCLLSRLEARESVVEIAPDVQATWVQPDSPWDGRAVVLCHGFASDMNDAGGLLKTLADALAQRGIASLRVNFRGEGDARRTDIRSTAQSRRDDVLAAQQFVTKQTGVDSKRVGAMGWSLGCVSSLDAAAIKPDAFRSLVLWSSPSGNVYDELTKSFDPAFESATRGGAGKMELTGWKTVTLQREFFESYREVNVDQLMARFLGAVLFVRGSDDYLPPRDAALIKIARGRPAEAVVIGGADHIFKVFDPQSLHAARVVTLTVAWFERTL